MPRKDVCIARPIQAVRRRNLPRPVGCVLARTIPPKRPLPAPTAKSNLQGGATLSDRLRDIPTLPLAGLPGVCASSHPALHPSSCWIWPAPNPAAPARSGAAGFSRRQACRWPFANALARSGNGPADLPLEGPLIGPGAKRRALRWFHSVQPAMRLVFSLALACLSRAPSLGSAALAQMSPGFALVRGEFGLHDLPLANRWGGSPPGTAPSETEKGRLHPSLKEK